MEFEQYLERDILTFLDSKTEKKGNTSIDREEEYGLYLTRDYLKELNYALDNDELTRAKKLFDELKANYSRLPKSSVERKKIYSLLEKMYEKIQNYVRIKEGKIEVIKQGDMEVLKDTTERFSNLADRMEKESDSHLASASDSEKKSEKTKIKDLPIGINTRKESEESKEHLSEDEMLLGKKKPRDRNSIAVESNISGSTIKDILEKPKTKEKEETDRALEKTTSKNTGNKNIPKTHTPHIHKHNVIEERKYEAEDRNTQSGPSGWKEEIIDKTAMHLEKLKMHVTDRLLEELRKKLDENNDEQKKKIESLREEIVKQVIEELDKRLKKEKAEVSNKIESLRGEILNKVFHQAQHIISSKDNQDAVISGKYAFEIPAQNEFSDNSESPAENEKISANSYSGEELRVVYEQAIYYMFDNKYDEAAKLFKKIIIVQPSNKAAHIRLQECIEKQPELSKDMEAMQDSDLKDIIKPPKTAMTESIEETEENAVYKNHINKSSDDKNFSDVMAKTANDVVEGIDDFKDEMNQHMDTFAEDIQKLQKYNIKHKYNDEELQRLYEEAVYTMFQSNYDEAARMFQQILRIRPENKAARIRLQECKEAIGNA